jgi:hypothetical protein
VSSAARITISRSISECRISTCPWKAIVQAS